MECDVAVLGGGPGGYTAAIRAAQLGREGRSASRRSPSWAARACASAASRPRRGCRPRIRAARRPRRRFAKFGVAGRRADARLRRRERVEGRRRQADDRRRREPVQGERRRVGQGHRPLQGREHDRGRGRGGRLVQAGDRRDRLVPAASADRGHRLAALRRLDRAARADRGAEAPGRARRRDHRLRVRLDLPAASAPR